MSDSSPVRIGVIGVGHFGRNYARILGSIPEADLVGVMDIDPVKAAEVAAGADTDAFGALHEFEKKVEAVAVVAPASKHAVLCRQALEAGLHVLVEKPFVLDPADAAELTRMAEENTLCLQVGHVERFNPAVAMALDIASERQPVFVQAQRSFPYNPRIADVGVIMDAMIHDLDLVGALAGSEAVTVHAEGRSMVSGVEDLVQSLLRFEGGLIASVTASRMAAGVTRRLEITMTDGSLDVDCPGQRLVLHDGSGSREVEIEKREPLREELLHFLNCVRTGQKPLVSGHDGGKAVKLACRIMEALKLSDTEGVSIDGED